MIKKHNCSEIETIRKLQKESEDSRLHRGIMAEKIINIERDVKDIKSILKDLPSSMDQRYVQKVEFKAELSKLNFANQVQDTSLKFLQSQYYKIAEKVVILGGIVAVIAKQYGLW